MNWTEERCDSIQLRELWSVHLTRRAALDATQTMGREIVMNGGQWEEGSGEMGEEYSVGEIEEISVQVPDGSATPTEVWMVLKTAHHTGGGGLCGAYDYDGETVEQHGIYICQSDAEAAACAESDGEDDYEMKTNDCDTYSVKHFTL